MSDELFKSPHGWWHICSLNDNIDDYVRQNDQTDSRVYQIQPPNNTDTITHSRVNTVRFKSSVTTPLKYRLNSDKLPIAAKIKLLSYKCLICNEGNILGNAFKSHRHQSKEHRNTPSEENNFLFQREVKRLECITCGQQFGRKKFNNHMKNCYPEFPFDNSNQLICVNYKNDSDSIQNDSDTKNILEVFYWRNDATTNKPTPIQVTLPKGDVKPENLEKFTKLQFNLNTNEMPIAVLIELPQKRYKCQICNKWEIGEENLKTHQHTKKLRKIPSEVSNFSVHCKFALKCVICGFELKENQEDKFNNHMHEDHPDVPFKALKYLRGVKYKHDNETADNENSVDQHVKKVFFRHAYGINTINVYNCTVCEQTIMEPFRTKHHFKYHREISLKENIFRFTNVTWYMQCFICRKWLREYKIVQHMKLFHLSQPDNSDIDEIKPSEGSNENLQQNCVAAIISKVFKCSICLANGILERNIHIHHATNHNDTTFALHLFLFSGITLEVNCQYCNKQVKKNIIQKHINLFHPEAVIGPVQLYNCKMCNANDIKIYDLNDHHLTYHSEISVTENIFEQNVNDYNAHAQPRSCSKQNQFKLSEPMKRDNMKQYKCKICGANGLEKSHLKDHHSKMHGKISTSANIFEAIIAGQVKCEICEALLKEKRLKRHMKQFHPQVSYSVSMSSIVSAKVDRKIHDCPKSSVEVVKLYKCKVCDIKGIKEGNLTKHLQAKHNNIGTECKIFELTEIRQLNQCEICGKQMHNAKHQHHLKACLQRMERLGMKTFDDGNQAIDCSSSSDDADSE